MHMHLLDYSIVAALLAFLIAMAIVSKRYMQSVADFLAAGRCAGRYVLTVSEVIAGIGAVTIVAEFEFYYTTGFTAQWWAFAAWPCLTIAAASGWVLYRFRQTRALTMAQFFEMRYNKSVRVLAGILQFFAGVINFGIFPAVAARFFIYFCGLPTDILWGIEGSTFALIMLVLLGIALFFIYTGGQITVIVTDFFQGIFFFIVLLVVFIVIFRMFHWSQIAEVLAAAPKDASMVDFSHTGQMKHFSPLYYLISLFGIFYCYLAWQQGQAYFCSGKTPHEAKMGRVLGRVRSAGQNMFFIFLPICAYTYLHHGDFADQAQAAWSAIRQISEPQLQTQMTVPIALAHILPIGVLGCFCAVMLAAFISTHDTALHSWGSIFIQDVMLPFRKKPLSPEEHIRWLRWSIFGVVVFVFFFSLLFRQKQYLLLFFNLTGSIFTSGVGSVIIGGLYWKRGTAAGALAALITGSTISIVGLVTIQIYPNFPLDGQRVWAIAMAASITVYVVFSLASRRPPFDMDRMLHRGKYAVKEDSALVSELPARGWRWFGMGKEFTTGDRIIYIGVYAWIFGWFAVFVVGTFYSLSYGISTESWLKFWHLYVWISFILGIIMVVWFTIGGLRDLRNLFRDLRTRERDPMDDGTVIKQDNPPDDLSAEHAERTKVPS